MENKEKQHVQLPNRKENDSITPKEQLIYIAIKRHMNSKTLEAFPSLVKISEQTGASIPTIRDAIKVLVTLEYISIRKQGRQNIYKFNPYKQFEPFSYEFLDNKELTFLEKSYLVATQQFMYKNNDEGSMSYSNRELSEKINMSIATISKCNRSLEAKQFLTTIENTSKDLETGASTETKIFHLNKFGQAIVGILKNHEDRISNTEDRLAVMEKRLEDVLKKNELLQKELDKHKDMERRETIEVIV